MRKELVVFIPTTEREVEVSVRYTPDSKIMFSFEGMKFAVSPNELLEAQEILKQFYIDQPHEEDSEIEQPQILYTEDTI